MFSHFNLKWRQRMDYQAFLNVLSSSSVNEQVGNAGPIPLLVEHDFLRRYLELDDDMASRLLDTISAAAIAAIEYNESGLDFPRTDQALRRFRQLGEALQNMTNMASATLSLKDGVGARLGNILQCLPHLSKLSLSYRSHDLESVAGLLAGLRGPPSIEHIDITWPTTLYNMILPVLQSLPQLKTVTLSSQSPPTTSQELFMGIGTAQVDPDILLYIREMQERSRDEFDFAADDEAEGSAGEEERNDVGNGQNDDNTFEADPPAIDNGVRAQIDNGDAERPGEGAGDDRDREEEEATEDEVFAADDIQALANLLRMETLQGVTLHGLDFSAEHVHRLLCDTLPQAAISHFVLEKCTISDASAVASSITRLEHLRSIRISQVYTVNDLHLFLSILAAGLPRMAQLEEMDINPFLAEQVVVGSVDDDDEAMVMIVQAAAELPQLSRLKLGLCSYGSGLDIALARCVGRCSHLKVIDVLCPAAFSDEVSYTSPAFCAALQTNYTLERVNLTHTQSFNRQVYDPWDVSLKKNLAIMLRLNACGRGYLASDPMNRRAGVSVLEQVVDDLDCIFVHLRESPMLCSIPKLPVPFDTSGHGSLT